MRRLIHGSWSYALCLIVGVVAGLTLPQPNLRGLPQPTTFAQKVDPKARAAPTPAPTVPGITPASPAASLPPPPGPRSKPTQFQDWMRQCYDAGQADVAIAGFLNLEDPEIRQSIAASFAADSRHLDPRFVARMVMSLPPGSATDKALGRLLFEWSSLDAEEALQFMETLPVERFNDLTLGASAFGLSQLPADRVAAFVGKLSPKARGWFMESLLGTLDQVGSWTNVQHIMEKVNFIPSKEAIPDFFLGMRIAEAAPAQVEEWIRAETHPLRRDQLISGYGRSKESHEPDVALRWDAQIKDPEMRAEDVSRHLRQWLETDRAAALAWLQSSEARSLLPVEQRAPFLRSYGLEAAP